MKVFKKIAVFLLALVLVSGAVDIELPPGSILSTARAADSPVTAPVTTDDTTVEGVTTGDKTVAITNVITNNDKVTIPEVVSTGGKTYVVDEIGSGAIAKKYKQVTLILNENTKVKANIAKSKQAKKTKKIVIKAANGQKLTASQFDKKAFKGFKGKIVVKKSAMTKKQFKKMVKKLRKGGFKGKIVYSK